MRLAQAAPGGGLALGPVVGAYVAPFNTALIADATLFHAQGGGQPGDRGLVRVTGGSLGCGSAAWFQVWTARNAGDAILHYGVVGGAPAGDGAAATAAAAMAGAALPAAGAVPPLTDAVVYGALLQLVGSSGAVCDMWVSEPFRRLSARLHSAGHLLDLAVRKLYAKLGAVLASGSAAAVPAEDAAAIAAQLPALPAGSGAALAAIKPGKGYHFAEGPYVEYSGALPAWLTTAGFAVLLGRECAALLARPASQGATAVVALPHPASPEFAPAAAAAGIDAGAAGICPADYVHLPPNKGLRIVAVGEPSNVCPCGGTHVRHAAEIGALAVRSITAKKGVVKVSYEVA